jgi:hypothetical protein
MCEACSNRRAGTRWGSNIAHGKDLLFAQSPHNVPIRSVFGRSCSAFPLPVAATPERTADKCVRRPRKLAPSRVWRFLEPLEVQCAFHLRCSSLWPPFPGSGAIHEFEWLPSRRFSSPFGRGQNTLRRHRAVGLERLQELLWARTRAQKWVAPAQSGVLSASKLTVLRYVTVSASTPPKIRG